MRGLTESGFAPEFLKNVLENLVILGDFNACVPIAADLIGSGGGLNLAAWLLEWMLKNKGISPKAFTTVLCDVQTVTKKHKKGAGLWENELAVTLLFRALWVACKTPVMLIDHADMLSQTLWRVGLGGRAVFNISDLNQALMMRDHKKICAIAVLIDEENVRPLYDGGTKSPRSSPHTSEYPHSVPKRLHNNLGGDMWRLLWVISQERGTSVHGFVDYCTRNPTRLALLNTLLVLTLSPHDPTILEIDTPPEVKHAVVFSQQFFGPAENLEVLQKRRENLGCSASWYVYHPDVCNLSRNTLRRWLKTRGWMLEPEEIETSNPSTANVEHAKSAYAPQLLPNQNPSFLMVLSGFEEPRLWKISMEGSIKNL